MRDIRRHIFAVLLLAPFLCVIGGSAIPGHAEIAEGPSPSGRYASDALAGLARLPDEGIPLGKTLVLASSLVGEELTGVRVDPAIVEKEIARLADRVRSSLRDRSDPRRTMAVLSRFLFVEEGFTYDCAAGNPDNYLLDRVIANRRGNCLGLTALYLLLAEHLALPLHGVYVPSHCFVRYEDAGVRFNIETGEKGIDREDGWYRAEFGIARGRPYLASLGRNEMIGVYLKSLGAAFSRKGMEDRALRLYREAAVFYPGLPDVYFNAGVSLQKKGLLAEAVAQYRRSLELDPDLVMARDNLGVALAKQGRYREALSEVRKAIALNPRSPVTRANLAATLCSSGMVEDGIREYLKVLEIDPDNPRALAGLTLAYYSRGKFHEAIVYCDRARGRGCEFNPAMLGTLERYREPTAHSLP